jgi:membrane-bound metal-dependent hydrolase YbcI (DUF457 family)
MLGREHALSGVAAGAAAGELILHLPPGGVAALAGLTGAFATLPDLDQCESSAARCLGLLSEAFAWAVEHLSGGHRHATHSVLGVAAFSAWAWAGYHWRHDLPGRGALGLLLALAIAAGLRALRLGGHPGDLAAVGAASAIAAGGADLQQVTLACALGCAVHIAGDMLTVRGCPLAWPLTMRHFGLPRPLSFTTGTWRETWVVLPGLIVMLGWLGWHLAVVRL